MVVSGSTTDDLRRGVEKARFRDRAPNGMRPEEFFGQVMRDSDPRLWPNLDNFCIYVFRGSQTGKYAAYYDMD